MAELRTTTYEAYDSTLDKDKKYKGLHKNRRTQIEKKRYDKMNKLNRQELALQKLQSDEFENTLRRFYKGGVQETAIIQAGGRPIEEWTKQELIETFYADRIWAEWNTVGIGADVTQVLTKDQQYKGDWAEMTQLYADLPYWGRGSGVPLYKWLYHFTPALIADPINLFTLGAGKIVAQQGAKTVLKEVSKKAFVKNATIRAGAKIAGAEAAVGATVGAGADALRQSAEIDANLMTDYNITRTLRAGLFGGVAQGILGGAIGAWSAKGKAGKFYDKGDGFKGDLDRDIGSAGTNADKTWSGESGKNVSKSGQTTLKMVVGSKVRTADRGNIGQVILMDGNKIKVSFVSPDGAKATKTFKKSDLETLTGEKISAVDEITVDNTILPKELSGAKPTYNYGNRQIELNFDNDIAKALYIVGGKGESASHKAYIEFLEKAGVKDIAKKAQAIRESIKAQAKGGSDTAKVSADIPKQKPKSSSEIPITEKVSEGQTISNKADDIKRKTPILNLSKFGTGEGEDAAVKELVKGIKKLVKDGSIDTNVRKGLLEQIFQKAQLKLKDVNALAKELDLITAISPELAPTITAGRMNLLNKAKEVAEIRKLVDEAIDPNEKLILADKLQGALNEKLKLLQEHLVRVRGVSDALQSQKLEVKLTDADKLRMEFDEALAEVMPKMLEEISSIKSSAKKLEALDNLAKLSENDEVMRKVIREVNRKKKTKQVKWTDALNEYATANILGDLTTHEVNLTSAAIRFQIGYINDFFSGLVSMAGGNWKRGYNQMQMAGDLFAAQFMFFRTSWKKAGLSWKANRSIGDTIEHQFDGKQTRNMETFLKQLRESDSRFKKFMAMNATPLAKFAFITLRGLQAGDTLMKNMFNRAQRVANVNQRMRMFYPELWKTRKIGDKKKAVANDEAIISVKERIRFEEAKLTDTNLKPKAQAKIQKGIDKLNKELSKLNANKQKLTDFQQKWNELYFQYEDEFGNFRSTASFNKLETATLDDLTKSMANDPQYRARENSFTQNMRNEMLDKNQFFPDQQQSKLNVGNTLLKMAQSQPLLRVLTGLHFVKTPVNLLKYGWQMTPILNRLNMEFNAMRSASDPIVRSKAQGIQATGALVYAIAGYAAFNGMITGWDEKDPKHRFALKYMKDGKMRYVSLKRYFPLTIPFMVMASIADATKKMGHMWEDPLYSQEQGMMIDMMRHFAGSSFSLWSHIFASNLMTQDFFKLMALVSDTDVSGEEGEVQVDTLAKHFSRQTSKLIPMATQWRWQNKVLGDAEAELINMKDHLIQSSPHELLKFVNEKSGANLDVLNFGNALSPKKDMFGNNYPVPKGLFLGAFQDPLTYYTGISTNMVNSKGEKIVFSERGQAILESLNVNWRAPIHTIDVGLANRLNMKKAKFIDFAKNKHFKMEDLDIPEGATMWTVMNELKGKVKMRVNGKLMTLNETIYYMIEDKTSEFNKYYRGNPMVRGKYFGDEFIKDIIRDYEKLARDFMLQHAVIEYKGRVLNINEDKGFADKIENEFMKKEKIRNKSILNELTQ
jgi:hypothetical protein